MANDVKIIAIGFQTTQDYGEQPYARLNDIFRKTLDILTIYAICTRNKLWTHYSVSLFKNSFC